MTTENQTMFVAPNGSAFVYMTDMPCRDGDLVYSPDGETFYALASGGFGGSTEEHDISFENPHSGISAKLHRKGDTITCGMETFKMLKDVPFNASKVVPLPAIRRAEYLCRAEDGTLYYVSADKYNYSYESFKMFVGNGENMRELPISGVQRYRDGGTTFIVTGEGTFFSPTAFNEKLLTQWGDDKALRAQFENHRQDDDVSALAQTMLTKLDPNDFVIAEDEKGVRITSKQ